MDYLTLNLEELFEEVKTRATDEGAFSKEEWDSIVDDVLEAKHEFGEMHDDEDQSQIREALKTRFEEFEGEVQEA